MAPAIVSDTALPAVVPESSMTPAAQAPVNKLFGLHGRTVVVTGGARGLGITLATAVLEAGGDVVCLDILPEPSADEWANITKITKLSSTPQHASYKKCDITNEADVEAVIQAAAEEATARGNPIKGLISCAGIQQMKDAIDYPVDGYRRMMEVNVVGNFTTAKHVARVLRDGGKGGSIVFIASMSGQIMNRGLHCSAYNSSKAAVHQMTRSLAVEWGTYGIRVNSLSPGYIRTAMTDALLAEKPEVEETWMRGAALGRLGAPEDFKAGAIFLLADGSAWQTGSDLRIDGGHCASA
ncbi:putative NADP-dependent mannitol dehydrogenase [Lasiodiplodia theobromae]|uniref:Putative NADP-dependent mannitol dehydrogenase n=1 Tax=Lasiodiplodia theobromae TaxID=45133 RepID=A0A5N5DAD7_9PEZI|nr:putative NADP-dependent mannitol dehydrogenase [Lasiodiplodia theobromae]